MKIKTSVTLSPGLLSALDHVVGKQESRSSLIEQALGEFVKKRLRIRREKRDLKTLNTQAKSLNQEAEEVLSYQLEM